MLSAARSNIQLFFLAWDFISESIFLKNRNAVYSFEQFSDTKEIYFHHSKLMPLNITFRGVLILFSLILLARFRLVLLL